MNQEVIHQRPDTLAMLNKSEIDQQIAIAHQFPRSIKTFRDEVRQLVTLNEQVAEECIYSLPRGGKVIEGPSARFAEIVINSWGNCRSGARIVDDTGDFIVAQGVFHDLQKNAFITIEVKRRITDKYGQRYNADMIGVTGNAASSIALRNAALKGVPKAFWSDLYHEARQVVMGDVKTLANRRADMISFMQRYAVTEEIILRFLGRNGIEDINLDDMAKLRGLANALKEGETNVETIVRELDNEEEEKGEELTSSDLKKKVDASKTSKEKSKPNANKASEEDEKSKKEKEQIDNTAETESEPAQEDLLDSGSEPSGPTFKELLSALATADALDAVDDIEAMANDSDAITKKQLTDLKAAIELRRKELSKRTSDE